MSGQEDHLIGRLALHYKLVTQEQLAEATRQQAREGGRRRLGEILVDAGLLTPRRFEQLLAVQRDLLAKKQAEQEKAATKAAKPTGKATATPEASPTATPSPTASPASSPSPVGNPSPATTE